MAEVRAAGVAPVGGDRPATGRWCWTSTPRCTRSTRRTRQETAANYKGGFGFHPIYCFADATGETLAVRLRPGNAGANNIADHVAVLDAAIAQLPAEIAVGPPARRRPGAGAPAGPGAGRLGGLHRLRLARAGNATSASRWWPAPTPQHPRGDQPHPTRRRPAGSRPCRQDGDDRPGAAVAELTDLVDLSDWPDGTRLIVRREPLHPGAQQSLFPSDACSATGATTPTPPATPSTLDVHIRAHAHVEDHIRRLKDSGASRFPFTDIDANRAWLAVVCFADALVRWFQLLCLTGPLAVAEPKTLRWTLWHAPARLVHHARRPSCASSTAGPPPTTSSTPTRRIALLC